MFRVMLAPEASDRVGDTSIVDGHVNEMMVKLEHYPIAPPDPMTPAGRLPTQRPEDKGEAAIFSMPHNNIKAPPAGPAEGPGSNDARFSAMPSSIDELRDVFLGSRGHYH